jgi:anti-sigma factor RsiW
MMMNPLFAIKCKINSTKLSRFVDRDPAELLNDAQIRRVKAHLAKCDKCTAVVVEMKRMKSTLRLVGNSILPEKDVIERLHKLFDGFPDQK